EARLASDLDSDPTTGADLGAGPGAGAITGESAQADQGVPEPAAKSSSTKRERTSPRSDRR
ncbi:MAG TPA: hypothetical protein VFJ25_00905, partial [Casimicrobiaceae bacterium]|nr:hypothetical protein [Casimicrobiaceae bacterium]